MNKNIHWIVNGLLGLAVLVLYILHFSAGGSPSQSTDQSTGSTSKQAQEETTPSAFSTADTSAEQGDTVSVMGDRNSPESNALPNSVFVNIERMDQEYKFIVDSRNQLDAKAKKLDKSLLEWRKNLEKEAMEAQKKYQEGNLSEEELVKVQQKLMADQQEFMKYSDEKSGELMQQREQLNQRMFDNIGHFLKGFAGKRNIQFVFAYDDQGAGGILYADPSRDVTDEVIQGLNKKYGK